MILHDLRRFSRLSKHDKKVVAGAIRGAIATWIALRILRLRPWKKFLRSPQKRHEQGEPPTLILDRARRIAHLQLASERRLLFQPSCLEHSLVLLRLLAKEGIDGRLRLGARKDGRDFKAHAWIEVNETIFDSYNDTREYVPFGSADPMMDK